MTTEQNVSAAAELRAAATTIRETAQSAVPGPWSMRDAWRPGDETVHVARIANATHDDVLTTRAGADIVGLPGTFAHIALWHPGVAELVAAFLDQIALLIDCPPVEYLDEFNIPAFPDHRVINPALNLARAINGGAA